LKKPLAIRSSVYDIQYIEAPTKNQPTQSTIMKNEVNYILSNKIIREFLENEALEQVASDIRAKTGSGTTAKAVEVLLMNGKDETIAARYMQYFAAGVVIVAKLRTETLTT